MLENFWWMLDNIPYTFRLTESLKMVEQVEARADKEFAEFMQNF